MLSNKTHSGIYTLEIKRFMQISMKEAWDFFSSPSNLSNITPENLGFIITSGKLGEMYPGQIITYKVSPFPGYTTNWITEITHVVQGSFFVDEQRFGPYKMWHHEHHFETQDDGVLMTDRVSYKLPFGLLGKIAHALFVKKKLNQIFDYREACLENIFGKESEL